MIELDAKRCRIRQTGFDLTTEANAIAPGAADTRRASLVALIADAAIHASAVIDQQARAAADAPTPLCFDAQRICGVEINVALDAGKSSIAERHVIASEERSADAVCAEAFESAGALDIVESGGDASLGALERTSSGRRRTADRRNDRNNTLVHVMLFPFPIAK